MNFYSIPLGVDDSNQVVLGSLRFIKTGSLIDYFSIEERAKKTVSIDLDKDNTVDFLPLFDLIIMNPPFTRATGRGGKKRGGLFGFIVDDEIRKNILEEYKNLRKKVKNNLLKIGQKYLEKFKGGTFTGIGAAGEGLLFLYLAYQNLAKNGRISFVLPKSILSGASWFLIRTLLFEKFHLEYVIVSYDKVNGYNFSESTNLSEALIIARKIETVCTQSTKFIMLANKPQTAYESKALAKGIINNGNFVEVGGNVAYINNISNKELEENVDNWGRFVAFPNIKLLNFIRKLNNGILFENKIPITKMGKISTIGIDRHQFSDNFKITNKKIVGGYPVIHGGSEDLRSYLLGKCNSFAMPINEKAEKIFHEKSSYLLIPDRIWIVTAHTVSMFLPVKTLSNMFYAVSLLKHESIEYYKALCIWLNSTFGLLLILSNRQETRSAWISLKLSHWRLQNILNIYDLNTKVIEKLSKIFDQYSIQKMKRLPKQYDPENIDPIRLALDIDVLEILNIKVNEDDLKDLYRIIYESFNQWFEIT